MALPIIQAQQPVVNTGTGSVGMRLCCGGVGGSGGGLHMPDGMPVRVMYQAYVLFACDRKIKLRLLEPAVMASREAVYDLHQGVRSRSEKTE